MRVLIFLWITLPAFFWAATGVADRIAVIVGKNVITQSEVNEQVRLTQLQNQEPLDLSPEARRAAAERLVDQQLLRQEMELNSFQAPAASEGDTLLKNFRDENYSSASAFDAALAKYGVTADELKQHLLWQQALLRFTEFRFRPVVAPPVPSANREAPGAQPASDQLDAWLKQAREQTRVEFKKEAFE